MGCGCGKNRRRKKRMQSSRMPSTSPRTTKINGIKVPSVMTPNQRRSTIAKINNAKKLPGPATRADRINERIK